MHTDLIVKWVVKEGEVAHVQRLLAQMREATRGEAGNMLYEVFQAESDANVIVLRERYVNTDAVEAHRQSEHYQRIVVNEIVPRLASREVIVVRQLL